MEEKKETWKVTPVLTGDFGMVRDDIKYKNGNPEIQEFVPSILFLLESSEHQIVVDTGFGNPSLCSDKFQLCVRRNCSFENILKAASLNPEKIEAVIFTHLHWDHVGNAAAFSNAVYYCQKKEWERAQDYPDEYPREWFSWLSKNRNRVRLIQGDDAEEIFPGIFVQYTGGHTCGSQMIIVRMENGYGIITGDVVMTEKNMREEIPVGLCVNEEECQAVFETIKKWKPARVYPSHDFEIFNRR